jgi:hypothetical protein
MIRRPDGTPYVPSGCMQSFNPAKPEYDLFNRWDQEAIRLGGSPIEYFEVFISFTTIDQLYQEDRSKLWSPSGVELFALYEPIASTNNLGAFGIDAPDEIVFELNYKNTLGVVGHPPKIGSRIFTPHLRENWVIVQRNTGEYRGWNVLRLQLICQRWQESMTTGEGRVASDEPKIKII